MKKCIVFTLLFIFMLPGCNLTTASNSPHVAIYVKSFDTKAPIPYAAVTIKRDDDPSKPDPHYTDIDGYVYVSISWSKKETVTVNTFAQGCTSMTQSANLGPNDTHTVFLDCTKSIPSSPPLLTYAPTKTLESARVSESKDGIVAPTETIAQAETDILKPTDAPIFPTDTTIPAGTPTIPPNRDQIAFASERVDGETPQVFIMNTDGSNQIQLIDMAGGTCQPEWSPDGRYLLFINPCDERNNFIYPNASIWIAEVDDFPTGLVDSSKIRPFIIFPGGAFDPDWSTSGIIFTGLKNGVAFIYLSNVEGKSTPVLLSSEFTMGDRQPDWSPDGKKIVFKRDVQNLIYYASVDGSDAISKPDGNLSSQGATYQGFPEFPSWSPDGNFIAYVTKDSEDSSKRIEVVRWDNHGFSPVVIIPSGAFGNTTPSWSPDGVWIVFASFPSTSNNRYDIYKVISGGGQPFPLTDAPGDDYQPVWRPKP